jgi:hypothetical protein
MDGWIVSTELVSSEDGRESLGTEVGSVQAGEYTGVAAAIEACVELLGRRFVAYALGLSELPETLEGDARRCDIALEIRALMDQRTTSAASSRDARCWVLGDLLSFRSGESLVGGWRRELGVAIEQVNTGADLRDLLVEITAGCFPAVLAEYHAIGDETDGAPIAAVAWSHPRFVDAVAGLAENLGLPVDLTAVMQPHEAQFEAVWVPYQAGTIQAVGLVPALVQYALLLLVLDGDANETLIPSFVERSLDCAQDLAAGRPTNLPRVTVLRRFTVAPGAQLPQSPIRLTWADPLAPLMPCQIPAGGIAAVHWSRSRLEVIRPEQVPAGETPEETRSRWWKHRLDDVHKAMAERRRIMDRVRVALMLCAQDDRPAAPDIAGETTFAPLPLAGQMMVRFDLSEPLDSTLGEAGISAFGGHLSRLLELPDGLDFGFERLLEGLTHSPSPVVTSPGVV